MNATDIVVVVADDAIERLPEHAAGAGWRDVLVVSDANTREAAGARAASVLGDGGLEVTELSFGFAPAPTDDSVRRVCDGIGASCGVVAVGSGVITDVSRYAAYLSDREFVSVPTAASMDGYASGHAVIEVDGLKVSRPARPPTAIFADPRVVAAAPSELTRSGIGDLLAKATARVDWLAAHLLYGEPFSKQVAAMVLEPLSFTATNAERVLTGDAAAIRELLVGLIRSGIAMALAGSSRPASGSEHHASHFWDLLAARGSRASGSHGLQVGYATRWAMELQRFAFAGGVADLRPPIPSAEPLGVEARRWLGDPPSTEVVAAIGEKHQFIADRAAFWPRDGAAWSDVRARLGPELERFAAVERALEVAGIPAEPGFLEIDEPTLRATFRYANRLRARYTVLDFLEGQGMLDEAVDAILG